MSPDQLEANRQNAAPSTGPVSESGKAISSRNAISHGLTGRQPLLPHEDPEEYREFVDAYLETYRPSNRNDHALVVEFAELRWRLRRVPVVEAQAWNHEMAKLAAKPENGKRSPQEIMAMAFVRLIENEVISKDGGAGQIADNSVCPRISSRSSSAAPTSISPSSSPRGFSCTRPPPSS